MAQLQRSCHHVPFFYVVDFKNNFLYFIFPNLKSNFLDQLGCRTSNVLFLLKVRHLGMFDSPSMAPYDSFAVTGPTWQHSQLEKDLTAASVYPDDS
jgi:hypothetical protein